MRSPRRAPYYGPGPTTTASAALSAAMASSSTRTWLLRLGAVGLGLGLLGLAELGLRASGVVADPPAPTLPAGWDQGVRLVEGSMGPPLDRTELRGQPAWRTSRRLVRDRFMHDLTWTETPPPGRTRIFAFGGSTTYGVPVEATPERTFPGRMQAGLERLGLPAEVLNLGGASFGSDEVVALMQAVAEHGARAWVLYSANNEFFQYQMELDQHNASYPVTRLHLQRWHLFRAMEGLLAPAPPELDQAAAVEEQELRVARIIEASLVDPSARPAPGEDGRWHRRDPHHAAVIARYRANLEQMEARAAAAGALLLIVDVQPNLQQEPWLSLHDPELGSRGRARVASLLEDSARLRSAGDAQAAAALASEALELDPTYAASWHALGMARLDQDQLDQARRSLENALELDMNPGRPLLGISRAIDEVTADGGSLRLDLDRIWSAPEAGPFGGRLFHDSCHLTAEAYDKLGRELAMALRLELAAAPR